MCYDHVTPSVKRLHDCSFGSFIDFRLLLLFYKVLKYVQVVRISLLFQEQMVT